MNENTDMWEALEAAMKDTTVKERYFLTPAALDAATDRGEGGEENQDLPGERAPGREEVMEVMEVMEDHVKERANTVVGNPREEESKEKV